MSAVALLLLSGCDYNEENFKGLDEMTQPENVLNLDYTLTAENYKSFAKETTPYISSYFASEEEADELFPAWLAKKYYTASPTSVVRVTFNLKDQPSTLLKPYTKIVYTGLEKNEDYVPTFYPAGTYAPYLNTEAEKNIITKLLNVKYVNPKKGDYVMVGYNFSDDPIQTVETPVFNYDFEADAVADPLEKLGNWYINVTGDKKWKLLNYSNNNYIQYSANGAAGVCEAWMVTPEVAIVGNDKNLAFDINVGYFDADCLSVLISTDFDGKDVTKATWADVTTNFTIPQDKSYAGFKPAGVMSLAEYAGKKVRVAFKYLGNGDKDNKKTTTYQIDNVVIGKDIPKPVSVKPRFKLFQCTTDGKWSDFINGPKNNAICPLYSDYTAMGAPGTNLYFSSTVLPENYLPSYLVNNAAAFGLLYPQNKDARVLIYKYYNATSKKIEAQAAEYIYSSEAGRWEYNNQIVPKIRQYAFDGAKWLFDPSTTVTLKAKGDKPTADFYQIITDWVKVNKGAEYVTSFGNNDYYYGGSAYNNNFDFRPAAWKGQNGAAYGEKSDEELKTLMYSRLPEAFIPGLEATYPNAEPVEGVNVIYTVNFLIYDGSATTSWTIKYEVTAKAKFTYVENSLKEVK